MSADIKRSDGLVNLSTASLWPTFAFTSTDRSLDWAKRCGYDGLEVLPGWSACWEYRKYGILTGENGINSFHDSWRRDGRAEKEYGLAADTNRNFPTRLRSALLRAVFPAERITCPTLQGLEVVHQAPVVFHWPEDTFYWQRPILEVHPYINMSPEELRNWAEKDAKRGLAVDVSKRKLWEYLRLQGIPEEEWQDMLRTLLPVTREVHFQVASQDEIRQITSSINDGSLGSVLSLIKRQGGDIPIVAEIKPMLLSNSSERADFAGKVLDFIRKA